MADDPPYYVTINPAVAHRKFNTVVMRRSREDEYEVYRISQPLTSDAALHLARSWAAALQCEIR